MDDFFKGLKILELASVLAGPSVGMFFAELGATVIKIENKNTGGDVTRNWKLPSERNQKNQSAYFSSINYKKKYILLDLKNKKDYSIFLQLANNSDIIISNYRNTQAQKLNVDYTTIQKTNPKIIYAQLTGFGSNNNRPAFDVVLQAESGFMFMNGEPNQLPVKMPVALIDVLAAHQMKEAILMALLKKEKTGQGSFIEASLYESAVSSLVNQASNWLMAGHIPQAMGSLHPNIAPYGESFLTSDKKRIVLAVGTEKQFINLCNSLNLDIYEDETFSTNTKRVENRIELFHFLSKKIETKNMEELEQIFLAKNVPYGRVRNMEEVFENPLAQKMILEEKHEEEISKRVSSIAFTIS